MNNVSGSNNVIQSIQERLKARKRPTLQQTEALMRHLLHADRRDEAAKPVARLDDRATDAVVAGWRHNVREFYERHIDGWRAIVSGDTEDAAWIAYVEQGEVRIYASRSFPFIQDALQWCEDEIRRQLQPSDELPRSL